MRWTTYLKVGTVPALLLNLSYNYKAEPDFNDQLASSLYKSQKISVAMVLQLNRNACMQLQGLLKKLR